MLKVFIDNFKFNVENIANLLETCGRFLLRYEGTAETAKSMVRVESLLALTGAGRVDAAQAERDTP